MYKIKLVCKQLSRAVSMLTSLLRAGEFTSRLLAAGGEGGLAVTRQQTGSLSSVHPARGVAELRLNLSVQNKQEIHVKYIPEIQNITIAWG